MSPAPSCVSADSQMSSVQPEASVVACPWFVTVKLTGSVPPAAAVAGTVRFDTARSTGGYGRT